MVAEIEHDSEFRSEWQHGDMENEMNTLDGVRKSEGVGVGTGLSKDFKRS